MLQGTIFGLRGPFQAQEGPSWDQKGQFTSKVGKKLLVFIFGRGHSPPVGPSMANFTPITRALATPLRIKIFCLKEWKPKSIGNVKFFVSMVETRLTI